MEELLAQLLQQRALQTKAESDARTGASLQQVLAGRVPYKPTPGPGMPGNAFDPDESHEGTYGPAGFERDRFPRVPAGDAKPVIVAGDNADTGSAAGLEGTPEYMTSSQIRNAQKLYRKPTLDFRENFKGIDEPLDLVSDASLDRDDDIQQTGWLPADFNDMSHAAAAALIADQLRTRRIRQMGEASPDFLQTLPQY
jgi:hypothetical protein